MKPIPIIAARNIAEQYGYDQVVIIARKVGDDGGEHVTTYGRDKANCDVAARIGNFLKFKVMGWVAGPAPTRETGMTAKERYDLAVIAHRRDQQRPDFSMADSVNWYHKMSAILRDIDNETRQSGNASGDPDHGSEALAALDEALRLLSR